MCFCSAPFQLFGEQIIVNQGRVAEGVTAVCVPQRELGVWSCWLMDYSDICFIHSLTSLLQQPQRAPQKCSSSHLEARLPINKMVTVQNPDKIWMLFISWTWQLRRMWGGGLNNCKGMMSRRISI